MQEIIIYMCSNAKMWYICTEMLKYTCWTVGYICVNVQKYMMKCELGKVIEMGILTCGYYPHPTGYSYGTVWNPRWGYGYGYGQKIMRRVRVWATITRTRTRRVPGWSRTDGCASWADHTRRSPPSRHTLLSLGKRLIVLYLKEKDGNGSRAWKRHYTVGLPLF